MIKGIFLYLILLAPLLYGAFIDDDLDGVANEDDMCPNSALTDIVGMDGCKVEKIKFKKDHHFDVSLGFSYSKFDDNLSQNSKSISLGYYYGNFSAWFYTSDYDLKTGESGAGDTTIGLYYRGEFKNIGYKAGVGSYIATDGNSANKSDFFVESKLIYYHKSFDSTILYQHTFMRDSGSKDSDQITLSGGYLVSEKIYTSLLYTIQTSIYKGEQNLQNIAFYTSYNLSKHMFVSGELSKGLSDSATDIYYVLNLGYYF